MSDTLPKHVGIILDGNRRWAAEKGLPTLEGHHQGAEVFKNIALHAFDRGVNYLSAYVFSTENWSRTEEEVGYLMKLLLKGVEKYLAVFHERGVRVVVLGSREGLSKTVLAAIEKTENLTKDGTKATLAICFNYGGQQEIVDAAKKAQKEGKLEAMEVVDFEQYLYSPDIPPVDLLIRTSGEQRLSGFMLWRAAYAELLFLKKYWPDFTKSDFDGALAEYAHRARRFGG